MRLYPHRRLAWAVLCTVYLWRTCRLLRSPHTWVYPSGWLPDDYLSSGKSVRPSPKSVKPRPTAKQRKVLDFCDETPRTAQEILDMVGVKYHTKTLDQYINKLVDADLLRPTGAKIHDSNRRYITAHPSTNRWPREDREKSIKKSRRNAWQNKEKFV